MTCEELEALVAFVIDEPSALNTIRQPDLAASALELAIKRCCTQPPQVWVKRIKYARPECRNALYQVLVYHYKDRSDASDFIIAVMEATYNSTYGGWDRDALLDFQIFKPILDNTSVLQGLLGYRNRAILDEDNPFYGKFNTDAYWQRNVRWYIVKKDWSRAWEELKKADRGFPVAGATSVQIMQGNARRCFPASTKAITALVTELHAAMRQTNSVPLVGINEFIIAGSPLVFEREKQIPGYTVASKHFLLAESISPRGKLIFSPLGAMVIAIATYHRSNENILRNKNQEKKLEKRE